MSVDHKVRVLRIIGQCKTGGTETIALNYYQNIDHEKIGMDFLFYGSSLPRFSEELEKNGDRTINVTDYSENMIRSILDIRRVVKEGKYDIVHAQLNALNFFPLLGAKMGGAKIRIAANHSTANMRYEFKKSIVKYLIRPSAKWMATDYAACSRYAGAWCFGRNALKKKKIKIIHNAIDLDEFKFNKETRDKVRKNEGWGDAFVIGHAGRFIEQKNHKFIVDIFNEVLKKHPNSLLVLAGDGDLLKNTKAQVRSLGIEKNVRFLGTRFDMNELMQGMDLFLFPSLYEGLGNVITESQAVGLRSVVSNVVPKEVRMTGLVKFMSLKDSAKKWADVILKYANGYERKDTHESLIRSGYEIKRAAKNLEKYYRGLVNERRIGKE